MMFSLVTGFEPSVIRLAVLPFLFLVPPVFQALWVCSSGLDLKHFWSFFLRILVVFLFPSSPLLWGVTYSHLRLWKSHRSSVTLCCWLLSLPLFHLGDFCFCVFRLPNRFFCGV